MRKPNKGHFKKGHISWSKIHSELMPRGKNHHNFGKKLSKETIEKMKKAKKGYTPWNKGKHPDYVRGENNPHWKGGKRITGDGYIQIHSPLHPFKNKHNYVLEHRLVMEKHLGRYLEPKEIVHHINGNKSDNRIENLELFVNQDKHFQYHLVKSGYRH